MKKNSEFCAHSWLNPLNEKVHKNLSHCSHTHTSTQSAEKIEFSNESSVFQPQNFFIPEWKGESLLSKHSLNIKKVQTKLWADAIHQIKHLSSVINKSLKISIFDEFLSYAYFKNIKHTELDDYQQFWNHFQDPKSSYRHDLDDFADYYSFQVILVYLFKVRFMTRLAFYCQEPLDEKDLYNPSSWLNRAFKKGSSTELNCESLQQNQYSWYRPSANLDVKIVDLVKLFSQITMTEMMKICTYRGPANLQTDLNCDDSEYSHALSHRQFGLFVNNLLLELPLWLNHENHEFGLDGNPKVVPTKFAGDHLTSLTLSHWLAQETNMDQKWYEIICPDFSGSDFKNGQFMKICQELQFMSYLVDFAIKQNYDAKKIIAKIMRSKYTGFQQNNSTQPHLFNQRSGLCYSKIVLNLTNIPKKNGHHYLLSQITSQYDSLDDDGHLLVFSNQNLFVPSHSAKVDSLLSTISLECIIDLENLKTKGEIANFVYLFHKKIPSLNSSTHYGNSSGRKSCQTFRIDGAITIFNNFQKINQEFEKYIKTQYTINAPLFQKQIDNNLSFEFFQNAIVDGKLLHSVNQEQSNIFHPAFFKNLAKTFQPLESFFQIESIGPNSYNPKERESVTPSTLLGIQFKQEFTYPFILIVDLTNIDNVQLEISSGDLYKAKLDKYGVAFYRYFGLIPKFKNFDVNVLREFFSTKIGQQIIQLSLGGQQSKHKSRVRSMLIPSFFATTEYIAPELQEINFLKLDFKRFLEFHPRQLQLEFDKIEELIRHNKENPLQLLSALSKFKVTLQNGIASFKRSKNDIINYNNPLIIEPLLKLPCTPIFPYHKDIYCTIHATNRDLHSPVTRIETINKAESSELNLYSKDQLIVSMHGTSSVINFIEFILGASYGVMISAILQNLKIPGQEDLENVVENFSQLASCLEELVTRVEILTNQIFIKQMSA